VGIGLEEVLQLVKGSGDDHGFRVDGRDEFGGFFVAGSQVVEFARGVDDFEADGELILRSALKAG